MIKFNSNSETVSGGIGLTEEARDCIADQFFEQVKQWKAVKAENTTGHLLERVFKIAQTDAEQCYVFYMFGRFIEAEYNTPANMLFELLKSSE